MPVHAKEFLDTIFDSLADDEYVCVSRAIEKKDGTGFWFKSFKRDARQWRKWNPETQDQAWYFCVSSVNGELNEKGSMVGRGRSNLKQYFCLTLDDIGTKATNPPVRPSWIVETSPGNYQWGYLLDPGNEWGRYEAVVEYCHQQGWGDAGAGGSYRLMRVPGSANIKAGRNNFHSVITEWDLSVWSLDELAKDLGCDFSKIEVRDVDVKKKEGGALAMDGIDPMLEWLTDNGHVVRDDGSDWVTVVCPWADTHTTGENTAGYSPLGRGSGVYVQTRAFKCLHEHCVERKLTKFREWASRLGAPVVSGYDPLPWLQDKYVYVEKGMLFVDLHQRTIGGTWEWTVPEWQNKYSEYVTIPGAANPVTMKAAFLRSDKSKRAVDLCYHPVARGLDTGLVTNNEQSNVNMYVPPNHKETDDIPHVFLDHVEFLLPDPWHREIFLNWLAQKIQQPASRSYAVVMVADGKQGTGRSWLKDMLIEVLQSGINSATMPQLYGSGTSSQENFTKWKSECQYLVVEESHDQGMSRDDYYYGYETFKRNCDTKPTKNEDINIKYGRITKETLYYNVLIFSNHTDAMVIPSEDRRITVLENPTEIKDYDYYTRLMGALNTQEPRRVFWWLMRRKLVSNFGEWGDALNSPERYNHITPPKTPARQRMIEDTRAPAESLSEWIAENHAPDLVTRATLKAAIGLAARDLDDDKNMREPGRMTKILWRKLRGLRPDDAKNGARYVIEGKQNEVRAIRNQVKWEGQDMDRDTEIIKAELARTGLPPNVVKIRAG